VPKKRYESREREAERDREYFKDPEHRERRRVRERTNENRRTYAIEYRKTDAHYKSGLLSDAKKRAKKRGRQFCITAANIEAIWPADNRCAILGTLLKRGKGAATNDSPSIDEIISAKGYLPGNIAIISHRANRAKNNFTLEELVRLGEWASKQIRMETE
jgi:hypothetical protein